MRFLHELAMEVPWRGCLDESMTAGTDPAAPSADSQALAHLRSADPVLARVTDRTPTSTRTAGCASCCPAAADAAL
jgi:hypothetical protein